jgi:hypothetical protein
MEYVGRDKTLIVVEEYDKQVIVLLLVKVSKYLNLGHEESMTTHVTTHDILNLLLICFAMEFFFFNGANLHLPF